MWYYVCNFNENVAQANLHKTGDFIYLLLVSKFKIVHNYGVNPFNDYN